MTKQTLIETLMTNGHITAAQAERVVKLYRKLRIVKFNVHDGYSVVHGQFFDRDVINNAVCEAK